MNWIDIILWVTYVLVAIVTVLCVAFSIMKTFSNPKQAKGAVFSLCGIGLVLTLSFFLANSSFVGEAEISAQTAKIVGTGLITFYFLMAGAVLAIFGFEIAKVFK